MYLGIYCIVLNIVLCVYAFAMYRVMHYHDAIMQAWNWLPLDRRLMI